MPDFILKEDSRKKLDGIVSQMIANKESDDNINFVVNDFKSKYGEKKNPVQSDSKSGSSLLSTGSNPFQNSQVDTKQPSVLTDKGKIGERFKDVTHLPEPKFSIGNYKNSTEKIKNTFQTPDIYTQPIRKVEDVKISELAKGNKIGDSIRQSGDFKADATNAISNRIPVPQKEAEKEGEWTNIVQNVAANFELAGTKLATGLSHIANDLGNDPGIKDFAIAGLNGNKQRMENVLQDHPLPDTFWGNTVASINSFAPDIALAALAPEAKLAQGAGAIAKIGHVLFNGFTKAMVVKGGLEGYSNAREQGKTGTDVALETGKGAAHGLATGVEMAALGWGSHALTGAIMKQAEKAGLTGLKGIATKELVNLSTDVAAFGLLSPFSHAAMEGHLPTAKEISSGIGIAAAFRIKGGMETMYEHGKLNAALKETSNLRQGIAVSNFVDATPESILEVHNSGMTASGLNLKALEATKKARETTNVEDKKEYVRQAILYTKASNVKGVSDMVVENANGFKEFKESDIPEDLKQAFLDKASLINKQINPLEIHKAELGDQVSAFNEQIAQHNEVIKNSADPIERAQAEVDLESITKDREKAYDELKGVIKNGLPKTEPAKEPAPAKELTPVENKTNDTNLDTQPQDAILDGENTAGTTTTDSTTQADTGAGTTNEATNSGDISEIGDSVVGSEVVLQKAETDLHALKQVTDKVKKYEGSIKRLSEAKKAGQITEAEFNATKERFDDVMADYTPKGTKSTDVGEVIPDQVVSQDAELDNIEVPEEKKAFHAEQKDRAIADIKAQWQKLSVVGIANDPIQQDKDVNKLLASVARYSYHSFMDGSVKLKGKIADIVDEIINRLGLDGISKAQYKQIAEAIKAESEKARTELKAFKVTTKTIIKENTQVKSDFKSKDLISKLTQFKRRLSDEVRGFKKGVKEGKADAKEKQQSKDDIIGGLREEIKLQIKEAKDSGLISNKIKPQTFINAINRLNNARTPMQLLKAIDYMNNVFGDIDYDNNLTEANQLRNQVKKLAKRKGLPSNIVTAMRNIARAVPSELSDIKEYNTLMKSVIDNVKGDSITGIDTGVLNDIAEWLAKEQQAKLKERYELLIGQQDGFSYEEKTLDEMKAEIDALGEVGYEAKDSRRDADEAISELLREDLLDAELEDYNHPQEIEAIKALKEVDLAGLSDKDLRLYNIAVNNLLLNGKLNGIGAIITTARKQQSFANRVRIAAVKASTRAVSKLADWENWASVPSQLKATSNNDRGLAKFYVITGLSGVKNGYVRANKRVSVVEKAIGDIIKKNKELRNSPRRQLEVAIFADLNQYDAGATQAEIKEGFDGRKTALLETIDRLKVKSTNDVRFKKSHANYIELLEGIYDSIKDFNSIDDIKLDGDQKELYTYMRDFYDSIQEDTRLNAEVYNNIDFKPVENYFPRTYNHVDDLFGANAEKQMETKIITGAEFYSKADLKKEEAGTKKSRTIKGSELPLDKVINLDLVSNFLNTTRKILYDIETQPDRHYAANVTTDAMAMRELTSDDSVVEITKRVALQLVHNQRLGILPQHAKTLLKAAGEFYRGSANRYALGGLFQGPKQIASAYVTTLASLGNNAAFLPASIHDLIFNNEAANKLMEGLPISIRESEKAALTHIDIKESDVSKLNKSLEKHMVRIFDGWNDFADHVSLSPLVWGDAVSAKASWMAFYKDYLVREGVIKSIEDFNLENESNNRNDDAAEYAEQMTSTTLNINERTLQPKSKLGGFFPFMSFALNAKINLAMDIARASRKGVPNDERIKAARMVVGHIASSVALNGIGWAVRTAMINQAVNMVSGFIGDDDEDKKIQEYLQLLRGETIERNNANSIGYIIKDVAIGGILAPLTDPVYSGIKGWITGDKEYSRPADVIALLGIYGIPIHAATALGEKAVNLLTSDDQFVRERFGIESADGSKVYIPKDDRDEKRPEWAKKSIALAFAINAVQVGTSISSQELGALARRIPGIVKKLEDKKYGAKRKFDAANIEKEFAEITKDEKTYVLNEEQIAFRKKMKADWLSKWYLAKKKFGTDKESEQKAKERANKYSAAQTRMKFKGKLQLKE